VGRGIVPPRTCVQSFVVIIYHMFVMLLVAFVVLSNLYLLAP
jgi:hypothetical protein